MHVYIYIVYCKYWILKDTIYISFKHSTMDTRLFSRIVAKSVASRPLIIPFSQSAQPARHFFRKRRSMKEAHHLKSWHGPGSYSAMNPVITYTPLRIREWQCNIHYLYGLLWINVVNPMIKHLAWCKMTLDSLLLGLPHCRYFHFCSLLYCQKKMHFNVGSQRMARLWRSQIPVHLPKCLL